MKINYNHWFKSDYWTFEEAAYLLSNIDPFDEDQITLINHYKYKKLNPNNFKSAHTFKNFLQLLKGTDFSGYDHLNVPAGSVSLIALFTIAKVKNIGKFPSRLVHEWENSPENPNKLTTTANSTAATIVTKAGTEGHFGQDTIDAFDSLNISGIAQLFSTIATTLSLDKWKNLANRAKANGLIDARETVTGGRAESTFNPVRVANWLISKHGSSPEHIERKLRKNLPERSKDKEEDIFGSY